MRWTRGLSLTEVTCSCMPCTVRLPADSLRIPRYRRQICRRHPPNSIYQCRAFEPPNCTYNRILPARRRELGGRGVDANFDSTAPWPTPLNVLITQLFSSNSVVSSPALEVAATVQLDGILAPTGVEQTHDTPPGVEMASSERTYVASTLRPSRR